MCFYESILDGSGLDGSGLAGAAFLELVAVLGPNFLGAGSLLSSTSLTLSFLICGERSRVNRFFFFNSKVYSSTGIVCRYLRLCSSYFICR